MTFLYCQFPLFVNIFTSGTLCIHDILCILSAVLKLLSVQKKKYDNFYTLDLQNENQMRIESLD